MRRPRNRTPPPRPRSPFGVGMPGGEVAIPRNSISSPDKRVYCFYRQGEKQYLQTTNSGLKINVQKPTYNVHKFHLPKTLPQTTIPVSHVLSSPQLSGLTFDPAKYDQFGDCFYKYRSRELVEEQRKYEMKHKERVQKENDRLRSLTRAALEAAAEAARVLGEPGDAGLKSAFESLCSLRPKSATVDHPSKSPTPAVVVANGVSEETANSSAVRPASSDKIESNGGSKRRESLGFYVTSILPQFGDPIEEEQENKPHVLSYSLPRQKDHSDDHDYAEGADVYEDHGSGDEEKPDLAHNPWDKLAPPPAVASHRQPPMHGTSIEEEAHSEGCGDSGEEDEHDLRTRHNFYSTLARMGIGCSAELASPHARTSPTLSARVPSWHSCHSPQHPRNRAHTAGADAPPTTATPPSSTSTGFPFPATGAAADSATGATANTATADGTSPAFLFTNEAHTFSSPDSRDDEDTRRLLALSRRVEHDPSVPLPLAADDWTARESTDARLGGSDSWAGLPAQGRDDRPSTAPPPVPAQGKDGRPSTAPTPESHRPQRSQSAYMGPGRSQHGDPRPGGPVRKLSTHGSTGAFVTNCAGKPTGKRCEASFGSTREKPPNLTPIKTDWNLLESQAPSTQTLRRAPSMLAGGWAAASQSSGVLSPTTGKPARERSVPPIRSTQPAPKTPVTPSNPPPTAVRRSKAHRQVSFFDGGKPSQPKSPVHNPDSGPGTPATPAAVATPATPATPGMKGRGSKRTKSFMKATTQGLTLKTDALKDANTSDLQEQIKLASEKHKAAQKDAASLGRKSHLLLHREQSLHMAAAMEQSVDGFLRRTKKLTAEDIHSKDEQVEEDIFMVSPELHLLFQTTHFNRKVLERILEYFNTIVKSEVMSLTEFRKVIAQDLDCPSVQAVNRLFTIFDTESLGSLTLETYVYGLDKLLYLSPQDKTDMVFDLYDRNGNDAISMSDILHMWRLEGEESVEIAELVDAVMRRLCTGGRHDAVTRAQFHSMAAGCVMLYKAFAWALPWYPPDDVGHSPCKLLQRFNLPTLKRLWRKVAHSRELHKVDGTEFRFLLKSLFDFSNFALMDYWFRCFDTNKSQRLTFAQILDGLSTVVTRTETSDDQQRYVFDFLRRGDEEVAIARISSVLLLSSPQEEELYAIAGPLAPLGSLNFSTFLQLWERWPNLHSIFL